MKQKKIVVLHAQVPFVYGGAELLINMLVKKLKGRGYDTELIQLPFRWYPEKNLYDNLMMWRLLDIDEVCGEKIDLVIGTKFPSYGAIHKNKVTWVIHQFRQAYDLFDSPFGLINENNGREMREVVKRYDKKTLSEANKRYTISATVTERMKKYNNIDSSPLYHPPALEGRYFCGDFQKYILSVGRLDALKRNDMLIKALPYCDSSVKAVIAGKGPEMDNLKKLAAKLKVSERVDFLGYVQDEDLLGLYANAGAVYFAPLNEDYGYVTLEAFLSKKPVITCKDSGGVLEFTIDDVNGYVCDVDEKDIGHRMDALILNNKMSAEFGLAGYDKVKDISWEHVIDALTQSIR